ncbi:unnamed protein product [Miscanthus lutarioriparius]|uniref:Zinc finger C3HC4 RING-type domain-containing protein n=1 Tax=Miscanthus lutarioriparius TaxID=422564 RepID=A0A811NCK4_9POAL|nr:unnamed protein product [Miscanthus lutarioriparius]
MQEGPSDSYQELHAAAADVQIFAAAQAQLSSFVVDRAARAVAANNQQAALAKATNNQHASPAGGADRPSVPQPQERGTGHVVSFTYTSRGASAQGLRRRRPQPVGGGEAITLRLETRAGAQATSRTFPGKEDIILARQTMLADAAHHSPVILASVEEEEHGNSWYDSLLREAQAMDEPGLHDECQHRFCVECMATYIEGRTNAGEVPIPCPDPACPEAYGEDIAVLHPEVCKKSIDFAAFSSWGDGHTERAIPPNLRAYCPNR